MIRFEGENKILCIKIYRRWLQDFIVGDKGSKGRKNNMVFIYENWVEYRMFKKDQ